jgi:hypothetical protein
MEVTPIVIFKLIILSIFYECKANIKETMLFIHLFMNLKKKQLENHAWGGH